MEEALRVEVVLESREGATPGAAAVGTWDSIPDDLLRSLSAPGPVRDLLIMCSAMITHDGQCLDIVINWPVLCEAIVVQCSAHGTAIERFDAIEAEAVPLLAAGHWVAQHIVADGTDKAFGNRIDETPFVCHCVWWCDVVLRDKTKPRCLLSTRWRSDN